jgi:small subunit ribosomal protein S20
MPVTKTAKRALRSSKRKEKNNSLTLAAMEKAVRAAKKSPTPKNIQKATGLVDKAAKKQVIHKNKAARIKSVLSHKSSSSPKASAAKK